VQYRNWRIRIRKFGQHSMVIEEVTGRILSNPKKVTVWRPFAKRQLVETES
jgi:hypothetical protein